MKQKNNRYQVYSTAFHGGGFESSHRSLAEAEKVVEEKQKRTDCICGCLGIVDTKFASPGTQESQDRWPCPYVIGAV